MRHVLQTISHRAFLGIAFAVLFTGAASVSPHVSWPWTGSNASTHATAYTAAYTSPNAICRGGTGPTIPC